MIGMYSSHVDINVLRAFHCLFLGSTLPYLTLPKYVVRHVLLRFIKYVGYCVVTEWVGR